MDAWVRCRRGHVRYAGRIGRRPFAAWSRTAEGHAAVDEAAARLRVKFLARWRAARRLWRQLAAAARDEAVVVTVQSELDAFLARLQDFAYVEALPRVHIDLHRLVVIPRPLINGAAYAAIAKRLRALPAFASLESRDALRDFFVVTLIADMDRAIARERPSPKRPIAATRDWIAVGFDTRFVWRLPLLNEPPWDGHYYVLELTRDPITRKLRKAVTGTIEQIEASLSSLSRVQRHDILRSATPTVQA